MSPRWPREQSQLMYRPGRAGFPCVVLIHGLGVTADFWFHPERVRVMAGLAPLDWFLAGGRRPVAAHPIFAATLEEQGFHLATWTQARPVGPLALAVEELDGVVKSVRERGCDAPLVLVGHSRGGLVARQWLAERKPGDVRALVTLGTPHGGSSLARWADFLAPRGTAVKRLLEGIGSTPGLPKLLSRLAAFLGSEGVRELEPESDLVATMSATEVPKGILGLSYGGTDPDLLRIPLAGRGQPLILPKALVGLLPRRLVPEEWQPERGDGLVSRDRARLPGGFRHEEVSLNHVTMAFDQEIARTLSALLRNV